MWTHGKFILYFIKDPHIFFHVGIRATMWNLKKITLSDINY